MTMKSLHVAPSPDTDDCAIFRVIVPGTQVRDQLISLESPAICKDSFNVEYL